MKCTSIINTESHKDTLIKFVPKSYYTFIAPTYEGIKKAMFRYWIMTSIGTIQSGEFEGTYNPSQIESLDPFVPVTPLDSDFGKIRAENYKGRFYIEEPTPSCGRYSRCDE